MNPMPPLKNLRGDHSAQSSFDAKTIVTLLIVALVGIVVFGALIFTMAADYNTVAADTTNFSVAANNLAALGPLFLVLAFVALPIGLAIIFLTRYI